MRRNAKLSLDDLDPEVLDAARDVARRAGIPLQDWIESAVGSDAPEAPRAKRAAAPAPKAMTSEAAPKRQRTSSAQRASVAQRSASVLRSAVQQNQSATERPAAGRKPDAAEAPRAEPSRAPVKASPPPRSGAAVSRPDAEIRTAAIVSQDRPQEAGVTIAEMMRRLDELDRSMVESRKNSEDAAVRAIEQIEDRLASVVERSVKPSGEVIERLSDIERRMGEMNTQGAAPHALGRRGRPLATEMRDAVEKVRQRQRELDAGEGSTASAEALPSINELQIETSRLRESLGALATGRDVGALEQAMRTLASDVQRVQEPAELAAIVAPIELMRMQVDRLADEVAENVHARVSSEVEHLASKVEGALKSQPEGFADRDALGTIFGELEEIRRELGTLAGPERVQSLSQGLQAISAQIAELQGRADPAGSVDELKPLLEEIRKGVSGPDASSTALIGRIDALSDKMDLVNGSPVSDLIGRLENIGANLQRPQEGDFASIQGMLRTLAEKVDHVGAAGGAENLDALEKQVVALASRLDQRAADPSVAGLEKMMNDLLQQVSAVRDGDAVEAAVERATRRAVAEAVAPSGVSEGAVGLLRADLADMRARQAVVDERIQATMGNLNATLERLVDRLGTSGKASGPSFDEAKPPIDLLGSVALPEAVAEPAAGDAPREPLLRRPDSAASREANLSRLSDELLEPGMGRPLRSRPSIPEAAPNAGDVKANFIAAARRAALAAQADVDDPTSEVTLPKDRPARSQSRVPGTPTTAGNLLTRLRSEIDRRRRPLLLGLAAVVLALGAMQTFQGSGNSGADKAPPTITADSPDSPAAKVAAPLAESTGAKPAADLAASEAREPAAQAASEKPAPAADPQTTQAISEPSTARPVATAPAAAPMVPKVSGMEAFKADLANLPAPLSTLKLAALDGEGAAVFDLAARLADGRGLPRDLALSAKLFEKLAVTGFAPAQFKVGSFYEKGTGVIRDLSQAKLWYGRAADQGNVRAMHNLAVIHAENVGPSGKPDFATAAIWFRRAAEYGVRDSQYNLAVLCARGLGIGQDLAQSYLWFSAAAAHGDEEAGRKREDVASKLSPKDLTVAKALVENFKPKTVEAAANEAPVPKAAAMSLIGAPLPGAPVPSASPDQAPGRPSGA